MTWTLSCKFTFGQLVEKPPGFIIRNWKFHYVHINPPLDPIPRQTNQITYFTDYFFKTSF
jgi:hypothetical protein